MNEIKIDYDDHPEDVVEKINKALRYMNLVILDDGLDHDGYVLLTIEPLEKST